MRKSSSRWTVVAFSAWIGVLFAGCGIPQGPNNQDGDAGSDDETQTGARTLESCNFGSLEVSNTSTEKMEDHFSDLPNQWSFAYLINDPEGQAPPIIDLYFGKSDAEQFDAEDPTEMGVAVRFQADGTSGELSVAEDEIVAVAERNDGEYVGDGTGIWFASRDGQQSGNASGTWEIDSVEAGETISGTITLQYQNWCSESAGSASYEIDYEVPLKPVGSTQDGELEGCDAWSDELRAPDEGVGQIDLTVDGESVELGGAGAAYVSKNDEIEIGAGLEEKELGILVESPEFGANTPSEALYGDGECIFAPESDSDATVTIEQNDSGSLDDGPTQGSFEASLSQHDESSSSCDTDSVEISGNFGLAVCSQSPTGR